MTKTEKYLPFILAFGFPVLGLINNTETLPEATWWSLLGSYLTTASFFLLVWYVNQYAFNRLKPGKTKPLLIAGLNVLLLVVLVLLIKLLVSENIQPAVPVSLWTMLFRMATAISIINMIQHALRVSKQRQVLRLEKSVLESEKLKAELNAMKQQINP
ncbi:MAG: hypothetical protein AAGA85_18900, partial [Bacteroidota bacterium]